jgi:putative inorganic carbon (HCO3(-)) transporter
MSSSVDTVDRFSDGADTESSNFSAAPGRSPVHSPTGNVEQANRDYELLSRESWSIRRGHGLTYAGLFLFTFVLYFRPYELIPSLSGATSIAFIIALATLLIYLPSQLSSEGTLSAMPVEVKCVLFLFFWALVSTVFAKSPNLAFEKFNEHFSKVAIIFVVMVNALRTVTRLKGLMWLGIAVGVFLSYQAVSLYQDGVFEVEGYRVKVDFGGMFGNPNDMAIHLIMFIPLAIGLGIGSGRLFGKVAYFASAGIMAAAVMVTQSRGAFLALVAAAGVLIWKLGKENRLNIFLASGVIGFIALLIMPGNYGVRIMSIFIPSLDPVGSADSRWGLLTRSILVGLRNPFGIGIGNFSIVGQHNQETHNAFTQVWAELGLFALVVYVIFLVSPLRKLGALERVTAGDDENRWINIMSKTLYASIVGYLVASFFGAVAYNWFIYYPVAYAVCLRRLYLTDSARTS